jgi:hypothetical protein
MVKRDESNVAFAEYIRSYVASSDGGGNRSLRVLCKTTGCYSEGSISAAKHNLRSDRARLRAADHFIRQGWRFEDGPVCPDCARRAPDPPPAR